MTVWRDEKGQGLTEYGLILALVVIVAVVALSLLGTKVHDVHQHNANAIRNATNQT